MNKKISIRKALLDDVSAINEIINDSIRTSYSNWSWSERSYDEAEKWFYEHDCAKHCIFVSIEDNKVTGFGSLSKLRQKEGYWPVVENSVYVDRNFRGKNIGTQLIQVLIDRAKNSGIRAISAWIDSDNKESIKMHKKFEFYVAGELKNIGEKFGKSRSLTIMQLDVKENMSSGDNDD